MGYLSLVIVSLVVVVERTATLCYAMLIVFELHWFVFQHHFNWNTVYNVEHRLKFPGDTASPQKTFNIFVWK